MSIKVLRTILVSFAFVSVAHAIDESNRIIAAAQGKQDKPATGVGAAASGAMSPEIREEKKEKEAAASIEPSSSSSPTESNVGSKAESKLTPPPPPRTGTINSVTRVVGEVGDHVVTSREVRINDAVAQAINGKPATPEGYRVLVGQERFFPGEVAKVLDEWSVYLEAKALSSGESASKAEIARVVKSVQDLWATKGAWMEMEVGEAELRTLVERKLVAQEFEQLKADPQLAPVSDEDAMAYYRKNRLRFGNLPFASFKENIKAFLTKSQTDRRLAEWREVLRRKYKVRNYIAG